MQSNAEDKNIYVNNNHPSWFVYILRCADNTLYTGITLDVRNRIKQHNSANKKGAKYTRNRQPVRLVYQEASGSRSDASKREYAIKSLKKAQKENLVDIYQINYRKKGLK